MRYIIRTKRVIPAILSGHRGVIAAIASRDSGRAREAAARFGITRSYGSYQALLDDPRIEAIYDPLPNHLHVEWTVKALEAGKHVLCEKPIALNAVEAQSIVAARDRSGKRVIEAFMVRCHPQWHRVRSIVRDGRIGPSSLTPARVSPHAAFSPCCSDTCRCAAGPRPRSP